MDLVDPFKFDRKGIFELWTGQVPLNTVFHYNSSIGLIWLIYSWKWRKIIRNPFICIKQRIKLKKNCTSKILLFPMQCLTGSISFIIRGEHGIHRVPCSDTNAVIFFSHSIVELQTVVLNILADRGSWLNSSHLKPCYFCKCRR